MRWFFALFFSTCEMELKQTDCVSMNSLNKSHWTDFTDELRASTCPTDQLHSAWIYRASVLWDVWSHCKRGTWFVCITAHLCKVWFHSSSLYLHIYWTGVFICCCVGVCSFWYSWSEPAVPLESPDRVPLRVCPAALITYASYTCLYTFKSLIYV